MGKILKSIVPSAGIGALLVCFAGSANAITTNLIQNSGFALPDASGGEVLCHDQWTCFAGTEYTTNSNTIFNNLTGNFFPVSHNIEDEQAAKLYGFGASGQEFDAAVGQAYRAEVWAMNWGGDPLQDWAVMAIQFLDGTGINLVSESRVFVSAPGFAPAYGQIPYDTSGSPVVELTTQPGTAATDWTLLTSTAVAPVGTGKVRLLLATGSGAIYWDDASLVAVPVPAALLLFGSALAGLGWIRRKTA